MLCEKLGGSPVRELRAFFVAPLADLGGEAVVEIWVIAQCERGRCVERVVRRVRVG
jgi:hypothetical protein